MSHVATIEVDVKDLASLGLACKTLGLELIQDQKTYTCWGSGKSLDRLQSYQRDTKRPLMPEGFGLEEMGKCEHAIRVKGGNGYDYEIGLARRKDGRQGWQLLCDISGATAIRERAGADMGKLKQQYAVEVAVRAAKRAGMRIVKRDVRTDGSIAIVTAR